MILLFNDPHLRLTSPRRRTDDIFEAQLSKLSWIGERARELNAEAVICTGDLGDVYDWRISMINRVSETLSKFPCEILTIIGNHDVPGRNWKAWNDTGIGVLHKMESIRILLEREELKNFVLYPFHSDAPETEQLLKGNYRTHDTSKIKIALVHAPIGPETTPYCKGHKELFIPEFDSAIFGDIHDGWPVWECLTGCKLCNPGSLTRLSKKDIDRKPQICIMNGTEVWYEEVPHLPASECFNLEEIEEEAEELSRGFLAAIAAREAIGDIDPKKYVQEIGKKAGYSKAAVSLLVEEIGKTK